MKETDTLASERPHLIQTSTSSIVVTTTAGDANDQNEGPTASDSFEGEELRTRPRGFFADQFEVIIKF